VGADGFSASGSGGTQMQRGIPQVHLKLGIAGAGAGLDAPEGSVADPNDDEDDDCCCCCCCDFCVVVAGDDLFDETVS